MPKERSYNPVAAQHKADKAKALKKSKNDQRARQNEKLARRNPDRLQRQIDELKELETNGTLRPKDKEVLERLEKEVRAVRRAREVLGEDAPTFKGGRREGGEGERRDGGRGGSSLGKRRRDDDGARRRDESDTDEDVRDIPMPRDTPPPIPRRNPRKEQQQGPQQVQQPAQMVYSSAPVHRDLAKEARRFVPAAVKQNLQRQKGEGGRLLEPEELEKLEKAGYVSAEKAAGEAEKEAEFSAMASGDGDADLEEEERRLEEELRRAEAEVNGQGLVGKAMGDAEHAVEEMEKEAQFNMMADMADARGRDGEGKVAEKELRNVVMEEVADEDL